MMHRLGLPTSVGLACLVAGLAGAFWAASAQRRANEELAAQRFEAVGTAMASGIEARMHAFEFGLRGLRGMVSSHDGLPTLAQVRRYAATRDVDGEFPGARGFGLIWRVPESEQTAFVDRMRADGRPDFSIRQLAPHEGERMVITYIEPQARNGPAVGLDIASEGRRRSAALEALSTGKAAITEPITLVQATGKTQRSFLVLLPVFRTTEKEQGEALGWSYTPVVIDEVLGTLALHEEQGWIELRDAGSGSEGVFYRSPGEEPQRADLPVREIGLQVFNRRWTARLHATPAFVDSLRLTSPRLVGGIASIVAGLLGSMAFLLTQRRQRARALDIERAQRAAIVQASNDGIVGVRLDGSITEWNSGAERLFGYAASEAVGRQVKDLLVPADRVAEDDDILARVAHGERVPPHETLRRHRDGSLIDVSVSAAPMLDDHGRFIGLAKTFHDIREAKAARRELERLNTSLETQVRQRTDELGSAVHDLRSIMDALPSMIGYWDKDLRNRMANQAYATWFGVAPEGLKGKTLSSLLGPDLFELNRPHVEAALRGEAQTFQRTIPRVDGAGVRHSLAHYLPDILDGEVRGFYVLVHDITELQEQRVALEAERRDKAALLQTIDAHAIVSMTDRKGTIIAVNDRFCHISGYSAQELLGQNHRLINSRTHPPEFWQGMWSQILQGGTWQGEVCNRAKDGSYYWVDSVIAPFMGDDGRIEKIVSFRTDITARKHAELELRRTLALLESVLESATQVSIIAVDRQGNVGMFNRGAERLLGYDAAEVVGSGNALQWHVESELQARADDLTRRLGRPIPLGLALVVPEVLNETFDCHYRRKDGSLVPVTLSVTEIRDSEGVSLGYIGVAYDISARLRHEAALNDAAQAARAANEAKSLFLANMSHEIRTPMNAVIGLAHLLQRTPLSPDQADYAANIVLAGKSLLDIINGVLDLSKIEAGEMTLERRCFSLRDLCSELQALFTPQAQSKGITLLATPDANLPDALLGDPGRLRQILVNLLGNALKFTDRGQVGLSVAMRANDDDHCQLRFEVVDTGIGIPDDVLPRLFTAFAQADASTTRRFGGTGLGLSIVKHLAELMGGHAGVSSVPGEGSRFWVDLPFDLGDPETLIKPLTAGQATGHRLEGMHVLLVDDSDLNLKVAGRLLEMEGALVRLARNGAEAIDLVRGPGDFDVVLMDVQMPVMDGLEAMRRIRANPLLAGLHVIALTAGNTDSEHRRAREAGFEVILAKPIDPELMVQTICRRLGLAPVPPLPEPAAAQVAVPSWPVLQGIDTGAQKRFAGDAVLFKGMLGRMLDECDQLVQSASGLAAVELAARMHKIKGGAATLGASELAALGDQIETALRHGQVADAMGHMQAFADAATRLRRSASDYLQADTAPSPDHPVEPLDHTQLGELLQALRGNDLSGLSKFGSLAPALRAVLDGKSFDELTASVQGLDFEAALAIVEPLAARR